MVLIVLAVIGLIVVLVLRDKKKNKKTKKLNEDNEFIMSQALDCTNVELPKDFFEIQCMSWMSKDVSDERKISMFHELKKAYHELGAFDDFLNHVEIMESALQKEVMPGFFTSQEEWDDFTSGRSVDEIHEYITESTIRTLPFFADLKNEFIRFATISMGYAKYATVPHEDVLAMARQVYPVALEVKWKELCISHPQYSKYRELFLEYANNEEAIEVWEKFYVQSYLKVGKDWGAAEWCEKFMEFSKQMQQQHSRLYRSITGDVSEHSSFYEIEDFSPEEVNRIVELYKSGVISGIYKKEKDPKYIGEQNI